MIYEMGDCGRIVGDSESDEKRIAFQLESKCGGFCVARKRVSS